MQENDEAVLVARAQRDRAAFAPLYDRYVTVIYRYCYRLLQNRQTAEDATSETFAKALAGLARYDDRLAAGTGSFRGWIFTIAHHVVMDALRRKPVLPLAPDWEGIDPDLLPDEHAIDEETNRDLQNALAELTEEQRTVMELRLAGLTGVEIAHVLGRTPQAVKSMQFRAISQLRARLREGKEGNHARHA